MYCKHCGKKLEDNVRFCPKCGTKIEKEKTGALEEKKCKKKKLLIVAGICICVFVVGLVAFLLFRSEKNSRQEADKKETEIQNEEIEEFDESEYIFPYSDKEYLTDSDVENLSEEELKADEIVEQYYSDILKEYQEGETEGYPGSESRYPNVNPILYGYKNDSYLYYALVDLCSDGMPELFIGTPGNDDASEYTIWDMYGYAEGKTERFLDGVGLSPAPINKGIGDHERYYICENLMIKKEETDGEGEDTTTFYQMKKDSTTLLFQESVVNNRGSYYWSDDGLSLNNGTKEQYESTRNKYAIKTDISWHKLADLELKTGIGMGEEN